MLFSIIIPVYNTEQYLSECIDSVLNQTYKNFELLLINDGSTDNSLRIANSYKEQDSRVRIFLQENKGAGAARNRGLALAEGEYILCVDSDDLILESTLSVIYEQLRNKKYDVVCFTAKPFIVARETTQENKKMLLEYTNFYERRYLKEKEYSADEYQDEMFQNNNYVVSACLYAFKNSLVREHELQFFEGIFHEDNLFTRELFSYATTIFFIPNKLYRRRLREGSITSTEGFFTSPYPYLIMAERLYNLSVSKERDVNLVRGVHYFFDKAFRLILNGYSDSNELKSHLFRLDSKLRLREYKYGILILKYPLLKPLYFLGQKIKSSLRIFKTII